jgi:TonB family protein
MTRLVFAVSMLLAARVGAQTLRIPNSMWLEWKTLRMALSPDSTGVRLWVSSGLEVKDVQFFSSRFYPEKTLAWVDSARGFLAQPLTEKDTGSYRRSPTLLSSTGDGLYVVRRQYDGKWSRERFLIMESLSTDKPLLINGDDKTVGEILDSLAVVSKRTPFSREAARRADEIAHQQSTDQRRIKPAAARPDNRPPFYPEDERRVNHQGTVLLSFYISADGKAEVSTVEVLHATTRGFLNAVLLSLPNFVFFPAELDGKPVRQLVVMPFQFSLIR